VRDALDKRDDNCYCVPVSARKGINQPRVSDLSSAASQQITGVSSITCGMGDRTRRRLIPGREEAQATLQEYRVRCEGAKGARIISAASQ